MTREITYREAVRETILQHLESDPLVFVIGECIEGDGTWGTTRGLSELFPDRVRDTPISEAGMVGASVGAAMAGARPIVEIMVGDFLTCCMDEICNQAAKMRYMTGGQVDVPLVIRVASGIGRSSAAQHSQAFESWFMHVPGLHIAVPSTPYDAKGLLTTAIRSPDPVLVFEYKRLYGNKGPVPEEPYTIPFGHADIKRSGSDVTLVATGRMVLESLTAAEKLAEEGIDVEVIDPRTLVPLDKQTIFDSVARTNRALVVEEPVGFASAGATIAAIISDEMFYDLDAPVRRLSATHTPKPFTPPLEHESVPGVDQIVSEVRWLMGK